MGTSLLILSSAIFVAGYICIALEHSLKVSKSAVALITGTLLWLLVALSKSGQGISDDLTHAGSEVFSIVVFLLAAMSLIEILVHYRFFDIIRGKLFALKLNEHKQFLIISLLSFFLSAVIDNLTTTIIMIQISRRFFKGDNLLIATAGIVISANAGGAFSPIGDVTTIMLWFAKKFGTLEVIYKGFLPSFALWLVSTSLLLRKIKPADNDNENEVITRLSSSEIIVIASVFFSFSLPLIVSLMGLPPYFGLLFGLGFVWVLVDLLKRFKPGPTHLSASIDDFLKKTDISSLKFFIGILLAVSALHSLGTLEMLAHYIYGDVPGTGSYITGNILLGLISSILDNVPLTAMAIQMLNTTDSSLWILLAITAGTGGSLLVIGSAAGVVAMGMVKELSFGKYFKIAFVPALAGFAAAIIIWYLQYWLF